MTSSRQSRTLSVLIVHKNQPGVGFIEQKLRASYTHMFAIHSASDEVEAMEKIIAERFDCVLLGDGFTYGEKIDMRLALKGEHPDVDIPVIELSYQPDQLTARVFNAEAADYILKSHPDSLQKVIKDVIRKNQRDDSLPQLRIQYKEAQRHLHNREKQIQKLKLAIARGKEINRLHEQELKKALRRLSFQFENTPLAIIEWDTDLQVRRWSKEAECLFGWKSKEVLGKSLLEFPILSEADARSIPHMMERLRECSESKNVFQSQNFHKSGRPFYAEWYTSAVYNEKKELDSFLSIVQDITQLRLREQMLRESQERFRKLSQASFDGMAIHDQGIIVECNDRLCEIFGCSLDEMLGTNGFRFFTTESLEIILENVKRQNEAPYEVTGIRKDGSLFPVEIGGKPILYDDRELRLIAIRDITERKKAEQAIRESEVRFRSTFEQAAVGLLHVDLDGRLIRANQKISDISGYSREELLAMSIFDLIDQQYLENDMKIFMQVMKGEVENYVSEKLCAMKNGEACWINLNVSRVTDDLTHRAIYFVAVVEDISERKKSDLKLQQVNAELDTFVYNASHDLRGPIASLLGLCTVAQMEVTDSEARDYLSLINKTATHMNGVLLSLILMNRVKNHQPERTRIDFEALYQEAIDSLRDEDGFKNVEFTTDIQLSAPFYSDASLLLTILKNTLENAIRYQSPRKGPQVKLIVRESANGITIKVQDNGIGIPAEASNQIFYMFFRGTEKSTGPGLGLYLVQKIAEKLSGQVRWNEEQKGLTEFIITLPQMEEPRD
jgi:PAS domain S-box-containing protein